MDTNNGNHFAIRRSEKGQNLLSFLALFPMFMMALFIVVDLGRYFYVRGQVRIAADSAAIAGAGALDIRQSTNNQNFVINDRWARYRADQVISLMQEQIEEDSWMTYDIVVWNVSGDEVTVIVEGTGTYLFAGFIGKETFTARALSRARVAVGVDSEW